jgi:hypothetical protein
MENKPNTETVERLVLVQDPILGSKYELHEVEAIDGVEVLSNILTEEVINAQIAATEARGEKVVKYLNRYAGQTIYNEIALAIEFGYQLSLEDEQ